MAAYKCIFTGIKALPVDTRQYTIDMSNQLSAAAQSVIASGGTIINEAIQFMYFENAIFAVIPYTI